MRTNQIMETAVVIVNYNSGPYLERCLRSVLRSTICLEICIVDNDSSDDSLRNIRSLDTGGHKLQVIENTDNLGFSSGVNVGAGATSSPYLVVLNPDCYVHSHTLGAFVEALCEQTDAGMAGALVFNEDGTEQRGCRRNEPTLIRSAIKTLGFSRWFDGVDLRYQSLPKLTSKVDAVSGSAMIFHRRCFSEIGGMDEGYFLHCEDLDVCRRMRDAGYGVYFTPGVSLFHKQGVSGHSSDRQIETLKHQGMMRYYLQHYGNSNQFASWTVKCLVWLHFSLKQTIRAVKSLGRSSPLTPNQEQVSDEPGLLSDLPGPDTAQMILVTGGNSDVGDFFLHRMHEAGKLCIAPFRLQPGNYNAKSTFWLSSDYFRKAPERDLPKFDYWVNLAPIWTVDQFLPVIRRSYPKKIVALSSTSIEVKARGDDNHDNKVVGLLAHGESALETLATKNNSKWVILRPTLIYGGPRNKNINVIKNVVKRMRVFPLVGEGKGDRQPVHADDVAQACESALQKDLAKQIYTIAGAEVVSYRQMVERTFDSLDLPPRFLRCPPLAAKLLLKLLKFLPGFHGLSPALVDRMQRDQVFSNTSAIEDFGFAPRKFEP